VFQEKHAKSIKDAKISNNPNSLKARRFTRLENDRPLTLEAPGELSGWLVLLASALAVGIALSVVDITVYEGDGPFCAAEIAGPGLDRVLFISLSGRPF
jgi:hypothetical protein